MIKGSIQNRDSFLDHIAQKLGRPRKVSGVVQPEYKHDVHWNVLKDASQDELVEVLKEQCKKIHTDVIETDKMKLAGVLKEIVAQFGGGPVIMHNDERLSEYGLSHLIETEWPNENVPVHIWDARSGDENVKIAEQSNVGITFADYAMAESGTVVLCSNNKKGRAVNFLPTTYIAIIEKSRIVPRSTQVAHDLNQKAENGEPIASCINFISGPSNSADIEMNLVVGVHGPVKATYIIVS